jgi:hypothetical protein
MARGRAGRTPRMDGGEEVRREKAIAAKRRREWEGEGSGREGEWGGELVGTRLSLYNAERFP